MSEGRRVVVVAGRAVIRVIRPAGRDRWCVCIGALALPHRSQYKAIAEAVAMAYRQTFGGGQAQVVLHGRDGRIRWERTYPRSSDPRRSKG